MSSIFANPNATAVEPQVKAWSFDRLINYESCPHKIKLQVIDRIPHEEPDPSDVTHPLIRGTDCHNQMEAYIRGESNELRREITRYKDQLNQLREGFAEGTVKVEEEWAYTEDWSETTWMASDVWCRIKADVFVFPDDYELPAKLIDWKTGKRIGNEVKHTQQGQLYMVGAFMRYPKLQHIEVVFDYIDKKIAPSKIYSREKLAQYLQRFTERATKLTTATHFPPRANKINCRWCPYGPTNGNGACGFGVDA